MTSPIQNAVRPEVTTGVRHLFKAVYAAGPRGTDARPATCHGCCRHGLTPLVSRLSFTRSVERPRAPSSEMVREAR
jgi:hypothetical protein